MAKGTLKIHGENILPIIKKWLYTEKDIFLRELISNACDAISKIKILRDQGLIEIKDEDLTIEITTNPLEKTLKVTDTGIGMLEEEVRKYIAQVAFSSAEEFVEKYQGTSPNEQIIGHFGLGFYSSFMVSTKVEIDTLSYQKEASPVFWSCDGSPHYLIKQGSREKRGTEITLFIDEENKEFLEENRVREILLTHCRFLPYPILLNGKRINDKEPLWIKPPTEISDKEYIDFYHILYPFEPDPIFWIHLNVDYPFHLKGILYFPKITKRFDYAKPSVHLYSNRVFVSDNCKDLIPDFLTILRGTIDSPDIPLNVSRSTLQMDRTVRQLSSHIAKKVADKLLSLLETQRNDFIKKWPDIEVIIKLGLLQEEKFYERIKPCLIWKNAQNEWTTIEEYLEKNKEKTKNKIFYHHDEKASSHFLDLYKNQNIEILFTSSHLDTPLMSFLERKLEGTKFQRLDGALDDTILDASREKSILDASGKTEAVNIADFIRHHLENIEVEAKSLSSDDIPAFLIVNEEGRRMRDYFALTGQDLPSNLSGKRTFVVNTNNPLILSLYKLKDKDPSLAKIMIHHLFELSLLSQKELEASQLPSFIKRSNELLEKLLQIASLSPSKS